MWTLKHKHVSKLDNDSKKKMVSFIARTTDFSEDEGVSDGKLYDEIFQFTDATTELVKSAAEYGQIGLMKDLIKNKADAKILCKGLPIAAYWESSEIVDTLLQYCPRSDPIVIREVYQAWSMLYPDSLSPIILYFP